MANVDMKKYSTSLVIKEKQIKVPLYSYLTPVRMAIIITQAATNADEDVGKKES
jgi:hypothetical protein